MAKEAEASPTSWQPKPDGAPAHPYWDQTFYENLDPDTNWLAGEFNDLMELAYREFGSRLTAPVVVQAFEHFKRDAGPGQREAVDKLTLYHVWLQAQWAADELAHWGVPPEEVTAEMVRHIRDLDQVAALVRHAMHLRGEMMPENVPPVG